MRRFFTLISAALLSVLSVAQVPASFGYSCTLRDAQGAALSQKNISALVTISLNSVSYSEHHEVATDAAGVANFVIGKGTKVSGTAFSADIFTSGAKGTPKLKVQIDPEGGSNYTISGESEFSSVPYAFMAQAAAVAASSATALNATRAESAGVADVANGFGVFPTKKIKIEASGKLADLVFIGGKKMSEYNGKSIDMPIGVQFYISIKQLPSDLGGTITTMTNGAAQGWFAILSQESKIYHEPILNLDEKYYRTKVEVNSYTTSEALLGSKTGETKTYYGTYDLGSSFEPSTIFVPMFLSDDVTTIKVTDKVVVN